MTCWLVAFKINLKLTLGFLPELLNLTLLRSNGNITGIQAFIGVGISDALTRDVSTVHLDQNKTEHEYHR